jgi:hypothetical protein
LYSIDSTSSPTYPACNKKDNLIPSPETKRIGWKKGTDQNYECSSKKIEMFFILFSYMAQ